ncbi:F0F1 ATP synthase subunit B [candidate division FCPU426 bacterium]|nr:F0F1 ATP synthase subunit B [candidate division FCPU426 bacterium]
MIEIHWPLLLTQIATFLVAMFIIWKWFWGPLTRLLQQRSQKIAGDLERAEQGRREIDVLEAEYRQRLSQIEEQARRQINEAIQKGNQSKEEILQEARMEAQRILEKTRMDLALERDRVVRELRKQMADLSLAAIERLLGQGVDQKTQKRLLDDFMLEVEKAEKKP